MKQISMSDLHSLLSALDQKDLILDVRSPEEYAQGHIPGARNIQHDTVAAHVDELKAYKKVYIHCQAGRRAQVAASELMGLGLTNLVCVVYSGMQDWIDAGYLVEQGSK